MTSIFLAQTPRSTSLADQLRQELESKGYLVPKYPSLDAAAYVSQVERAILGSAAVVLLWSQESARPEWETLHIQFAQRFSKPLFPLLLDATPLPNTLAATTTLSGQLPADSTIAALLTLPDFPRPDSSDPVLKLYEQAANDLIRLRRAVIETADEMLAHDQHRASVLALLTYLAERDLMTTVQKQAREVLERDAKRYVPVPPFSTAEAPYIVAGKCEKGHVSYYNKRAVCREYREVFRGFQTRSDQTDELILPCRENGCKLKVVVHVDCGAYV